MFMIFGVHVVLVIPHRVSKAQKEMRCQLREMSRRNMVRMKATQFRDEDHFNGRLVTR